MQDHAINSEDVSQIFTRSSQKDLHKIMQGHVAGFHQDVYNIFSQGPLYKTSVKIFIYHWGLQDETLARSSDLSLRKDQERDTRFVRACAIERHMEMPQEPFHECAQSLCEPAKSKRSWLCHKSGFMREFTNYKKNAGDQERDPQFVRACAIEMHTDKSQESFNLAREFTKMMPPSKDASQTLCEPFLSSEMQSIAQAS